MPQVGGQPRALFLNLVFEAGAFLSATVQRTPGQPAHELPGPFGSRRARITDMCHVQLLQGLQGLQGSGIQLRSSGLPAGATIS